MMLFLFLLLVGAAQTVYAFFELSTSPGGRPNLTAWVVAVLCFGLAEVIRRQNQQQPEEEKQVRSTSHKHPVER